ncbi:5-formyltetrahydrofolate cyclo-ligase [Rhizopus delemar RA 99-880]|uniref:5-formyltetrahydrofolate cyclo-ligase n=1 Tax=Rhizopus delemar (strain RA 99-880 / ATCC MYA-4621 / FGSC 9543 / NRRL 43880) TaxID=246409 RepID=I1C9F2_RHIO9|nr:5-formyltetrahydrofolate cyclo-ligase [Rhizopus delemar RA 99-880]|eukprot:EIE85082.1 5-formyltetrahydrofolate cyclo-ligase [Rhizopus delemar RA 99-880]
MNATIVSLKRQLRKDIATRLQKLPSADILTQCKYMPTCEIVTTKIIHFLLNTDKNCFIPRCTKHNMDMVKINSLKDFESLPVNKWSIPEPPLDQQRENALETKEGLDLILVPGVAFDQNRNRIGHGKG